MIRQVSTALMSVALLIPVAAQADVCNSVMACVIGNNTGSGVGLEGVSQRNVGLYGVSTVNHGIDGRSRQNYGVVGYTFANGSIAATARAGVLGLDQGVGSFNIGVAGSSAYGTGVLGSAVQGYGGYFSAQSGVGLFASSNNTSAFFVSNGGGYGVYAQSAGYALESNDTSLGGDSLRMLTSSPTLLEGFYIPPNTTNYSTLAVSIDSSGNEMLAGTLTQTGAPQFRTKTATNAEVASYGARTSAPTLEDFGTASLRNGTASVSLEHTFASTIDTRNYMVFITPHGDSNGLFAETSPAGFTVRENKAGRSTLTFDYRIVAKPLDSVHSGRLAAMAPLPHLAIARPVAANAHAAALIK